MVGQTSHRQERITITTAREQADALLRRLIDDRRHCEESGDPAGRHDLMKRITGTSALDRAVDSMREMIRSMDELLVELEFPAELEAVTVP